MSKQFCSNCGNEIVEAGKFCQSCGHPISNTSESQQQVSTPPPAPEQPPIKNKPNNNFMILIVLAGVIGIGLFIYFLQKEAPEDVAEEFFTHIISFEMEKAERLVSKDADPTVREGFAELGEMLDSLPFEFTDDIKVKNNFNVLNVSKSGDQATVDAEVSFMMGEEMKEETTFELQKEKGKWKIKHVE